ncbi:GNAT family N-acetyltransferase [Paracoccus sediminis]|nr:GNAT family N-acetyltransferase [Paracoccus sediminis]
MMPRTALASSTIDFFVLRDSGKPVGMAALKRLDGDQAEIKSMHVLAETRGNGLSRLMLDRLIDHAKGAGLIRLVLETGAQPSFSPARALYTAAGFRECPPFGDYRPDPNSVFMAQALA